MANGSTEIIINWNGEFFTFKFCRQSYMKLVIDIQVLSILVIAFVFQQLCFYIIKLFWAQNTVTTTSKLPRPPMHALPALRITYDRPANEDRDPRTEAKENKDWLKWTAVLWNRDPYIVGVWLILSLLFQPPSIFTISIISIIFLSTFGGKYLLQVLYSFQSPYMLYVQPLTPSLSHHRWLISFCTDSFFIYSLGDRGHQLQHNHFDIYRISYSSVWVSKPTCYSRWRH
jgi:hypothetical protein